MVTQRDAYKQMRAGACQSNNEAIVRFVELALNCGAVEAVDELIAADYVGHWPPSTTPMFGPGGVARRVLECRRAVLDLYVKIDGLIAEDDQVAVIWRAAGARRKRHASPTLVRYGGISVVRLLAGKQVESRTVWQASSDGAD